MKDLDTAYPKVYHFFAYFFVGLMSVVLILKNRYLFSILPGAVATVGVVGIIGLFILFFRKRQNVYTLGKKAASISDGLSYGQMLLILLLVSMVTKLAAMGLFGICSIDDNNDVEVYVTSAYELVTQGNVIRSAGYVSTYPHMFWFAVFLTPPVALFGVSQTVLSVYQILSSTVSVLLLFDAASTVFGRKRPFWILLLFLFFPSQILVPQYVTHEHALQLFMSLSVWLYYRVLPLARSRPAKIAAYFGLLLSLFAGAMVNAIGLVVCIAFVIVFFCRMLKQFSGSALRSFLVKCTALLLVIYLGSGIAAGFQMDHSIIDEGYVEGDRMLWTLYVGSSAEHKGEWNQEDAQAFAEASLGETPEIRRQMRLELLKGRYQQMLEQPTVLWKLLCDKATTVWGVFCWPVLFTNETIPNTQIQEIYRAYLDKPLLLLEYGLELMVAMAGFVAVLENRKRIIHDQHLLLSLILMGTTALLLLTECRNKYLIAIQPIIMLAALLPFGMRPNRPERNVDR